MSGAFPFSIAETTGPRREVILRGRSLPYQGVNWGGTQRVNISYFPGNPVATAQVIGQTYKPTTIRGTWKDNFLVQEANSPQLLNFPDIGSVGLPGGDGVPDIGDTFNSAGSIPGDGQVANRARVVRDALELIRRSGQLLRVEWGSLVRFGFLTDANFSHIREEDIEYELEFTWIGDTNVQPKARLPKKLEPLGLFKSLTRDLQSLLDTLNRGLVQARLAVTAFTQAIRRIGTLVTDLLDVLSQFADLALIPQELLGALQQQFTAIADASKELMDDIRAVPPAYQTLAQGGSAATANLAAEILAAVAFNAKKLGATAITQRRELARLEEDALLGLFISPGGVTLRDIATRFYGSPENWTAIQEFNRLSSSTVPRGTVIRVPRA